CVRGPTFNSLSEDYGLDSW
nr:immunoglobulin heavy chain junction region [Macaca mulatta]MOX01506.1 immunoglobulin heavy chain junction region [Macaca mulatta]MOX03182.1 immunoglobulin heavy chain junction region [Macaca mulatta]